MYHGSLMPRQLWFKDFSKNVDCLGSYLKRNLEDALLPAGWHMFQEVSGSEKKSSMECSLTMSMFEPM